MKIESTERQVFISLFLDTRRAKSNGTYPVKLRVFCPSPRKQKLYPTKFEFTKEIFQNVWVAKRNKPEFNNFRFAMQAVEKHAILVSEEIEPFSFEQFEKKLYRKQGDSGNLLYYYDLSIEKLTENNQLGTASNYTLSKKSILGFIKHTKGTDTSKIHFSEITPDWLSKYEAYMINNLGRSRTTISMYLRALRTLFNNAISDKSINQDIYPFGKRKYQIPSAKGVKKALTKEQLKKLFEAIPTNPEQEKAKDFWFFSYVCNGMNIKDIAQLKFENIEGEKISYYRAKTINTSKADLRPVNVYLTEYAQKIIEKYSNNNKEPKNLVFPILSLNQTESERRKKIQNFTRFINQNFLEFAKKEGFKETISTYWARHSFATQAIRSGASMEFVSEALNHSNLKTTQGYFAGFEESSKKELMESLMNF